MNLGGKNPCSEPKCSISEENCDYREMTVNGTFHLPPSCHQEKSSVFSEQVAVELHFVYVNHCFEMMEVISPTSRAYDWKD